MTKEEFRKYLVSCVKASGEIIIEMAEDIIYGETGDERDYKRMKYILGNMKFNELFHGKNFVVQCFED